MHACFKSATSFHQRLKDGVRAWVASEMKTWIWAYHHTYRKGNRNDVHKFFTLCGPSRIRLLLQSAQARKPALVSPWKGGYRSRSTRSLCCQAVSGNIFACRLEGLLASHRSSLAWLRSQCGILVSHRKARFCFDMVGVNAQVISHIQGFVRFGSFCSPLLHTRTCP